MKKTLGKIIKICSEAIILVGFLGGLVVSNTIGIDVAITIGVIVAVFLICFEQLNFSLHPLNDAIAEIQKWLSENLGFVPLHEIKPKGFIQENSPINLTPLGRELLEQTRIN